MSFKTMPSKCCFLRPHVSSLKVQLHCPVGWGNGIILLATFSLYRAVLCRLRLSNLWQTRWCPWHRLCLAANDRAQCLAEIDCPTGLCKDPPTTLCVRGLTWTTCAEQFQEVTDALFLGGGCHGMQSSASHNCLIHICEHKQATSIFNACAEFANAVSRRS